MYLKALEIQGFKSFPERTRLEFEKDITAIVGPNGSGKSNISDALLWVMGEQSTKTLRGGRMQDVIFGGTEARNPMGVAQVSLVIDNSDGIFDYDSSEVTISREYYRNGESEYLINREQVRLKDVVELLMDTGLGRDGYSIIGQGRIAEIVNGKSAERREILEEAAGISKFRYRKEEAQRKLTKTEENLLRVNDKIEELELEIGPLREQAEVAKKYLILRDELRGLEISLWMHQLDKIKSTQTAFAEEYAAAKENLEAETRELDALYQRSELLRERMGLKDREAEDDRNRLSGLRAEEATLDAKIAVLKSSIENSEQRIKNTLDELNKQKERAGEIEESINAHSLRIDEITKREEALEQEFVSATNVVEGRSLKIKNRKELVAEANNELTKKVVELRSIDSRISLLSEMEKDYEGYTTSVKTIMKLAERGTLRGIHGTVGEVITLDREYSLAIETALGAAVSNIIVDTQEIGKEAISILKSKNAGRATFLPIDTIEPRKTPSLNRSFKGLIGVASDLVSFDDKYKSIVGSLLAATFVTETLADAISMSKANSNRLRIVTLDGQLINPGGSMTGGSASHNSGILSRKSELEVLRESRGAVAQARDSLSKDLETITRELASSEFELQVAYDEQQNLQSEKSSLLAEKKAVSNAKNQLKLLKDSISDDAGIREKAKEDLMQARQSYKRELSELNDKRCELADQAKDIEAKIKDAIAKRIEIEAERTKTDKAAQNKNTDLLNMQRICGRFEQKQQAAEMEERQLLDKLWENYELSYTAAMAIKTDLESEAKTNRSISELKRKMSALGTPNLGAISAYDRVSERYEFLAGQRDDVQKAKDDIISILTDITAEMQSIFKKEFDAINKSFSETFTELFGGGKASLALEDESDILECGIDIKVQPPGKQVSTLSLLSGGEMAFVAIALYFAIIKVRPTPFCVMDEIEAALDEVNVTLFAEHLRKISGNTQFIVVTHRRGTMEAADHLFGVTMQEKGVSTVIALDLEEAEKQMEELDSEWDSSIK